MPVATTYPYSTQQKVQAADHWRVFAEDTVAKMGVPGGARVFVTPKRGVFEEGFRTYLETAMLRRGALLAVDPGSAAYVVDYSVEPVVHGDDQDWGIPFPLLFWAFADLFTGNAQATWWRDTQSEIIVSVALFSGGVTAFRTAATYYVPTGDLPLYRPAVLSANGVMPPVRLSSARGLAAIPPEGCVASQCPPEVAAGLR
ncbi:MAG TPA: hypothetical protein VN802_08260 [Stellaceae bacterium]|nr:hypothetical protein [Stellaceae bacterium]